MGVRFVSPDVPGTGGSLQYLTLSWMRGLLVLAIFVSAPSALSESPSVVLGVCNLADRCLVTQDADSESYKCIAPRNACEESFLDGGCTRDSCTLEQDCEFVPGDCFCPSGVTCVCGGGPPRQCRPKMSERER